MELNFDNFRKWLIAEFNSVVEAYNKALSYAIFNSNDTELLERIDEIGAKLEELRSEVVTLGSIEPWLKDAEYKVPKRLNDL